MLGKTEILELIVRHTCDVRPDLQSHRFEETDSLADLGIHSMDRAEIVMLVQESLSLSIPRVELFGPTNIGELASLLAEKLRAT